MRPVLWEELSAVLTKKLNFVLPKFIKNSHNSKKIEIFLPHQF